MANRINGLLPPLGEFPFQDQVLQLAGYCGWKRAHFRPARTLKGWRTPVAGDGKGFPDLVLLRRGRLIVSELKRDGEDPTPEQEDWLAAWREVPGAEVYVWRPADFDAITQILA